METHFSLLGLFFLLLSLQSWSSAVNQNHDNGCTPAYRVSCVFDDRYAVQCRRKTLKGRSKDVDYIDVIYKEDHTQMEITDPALRLSTKINLTCYSNESMVQFKLIDDTGALLRVVKLFSNGNGVHNVTLYDHFFSDEDDDDHPFVFPKWKFEVQVIGVGGKMKLIANGTITRIGEVLSNILYEESLIPEGLTPIHVLEKEDGQCCHQHAFVKMVKGQAVEYKSEGKCGFGSLSENDCRLTSVKAGATWQGTMSTNTFPPGCSVVVKSRSQKAQFNNLTTSGKSCAGDAECVCKGKTAFYVVLYQFGQLRGHLLFDVPPPDAPIYNIYLSSSNVITQNGNTVSIEAYSYWAQKPRGSKYTGRYTMKERFNLETTRTFTLPSNNTKVLMYSPRCKYCLLKQQALDIVVFFVYSKPLTIIVGKSKLKEWDHVSLKITEKETMKVDTVILDGERQNIIIFMKHVNEYSVTVFKLDGSKYCSQKRFKIKTNMTIRYEDTLLIEVTAHKEKWISTNGGCSFTTVPHLAPSHLMNSGNLPFKTVRYDLFSPKRNQRCYHEIFNQLYNFQYEGTEFVDGMNHDVCSMNHGLYMSPYLPKNIGIIMHSMNNESFMKIITADQNHPGWTQFVKGKIIVCPQYGISCKVTHTTNTTHVKAHCREEKHSTSIITCPKNTWFLVWGFDRTARASKIINATFQQTCVDVTIQNKNEFKFVDKYLPEIDSRYGSPVGRDAFYANLGETVDGTLSLKRVLGNITDGKTRLCFEANLLVFFKDYAELSSSCPILSLTISEKRKLLYLDINQSVNVVVTLRFDKEYPIASYFQKLSLVYVFLSHVKHLDIRTKQSIDRNVEILNMTLKQKSRHHGLTTLVIKTEIEHPKCKPYLHHIKIVGSCPSYKRIYCEKPYIPGGKNYNLSKSRSRSFEIPRNYQPPSLDGAEVPTTTNMYNVDGNVTKTFGVKPIYKQCSGTLSRKECYCNRRKTNSTRVKFSDCIEVAYRVLYQERLMPNITMSSATNHVTLQHGYNVFERNNRTDYVIGDCTDTNDTDRQFCVMKVANGSNIRFLGVGLYHFRIALDKEKDSDPVSFCEFATEFIVYVDKAALTLPLMTVVKSTALSLFCSVFFALFICRFFKRTRTDDDDDDSYY